MHWHCDEPDRRIVGLNSFAWFVRAEVGNQNRVVICRGLEGENCSEAEVWMSDNTSCLVKASEYRFLSTASVVEERVFVGSHS